MFPRLGQGVFENPNAPVPSILLRGRVSEQHREIHLLFALLRAPPRLLQPSQVLRRPPIASLWLPGLLNLPTPVQRTAIPSTGETGDLPTQKNSPECKWPSNKVQLCLTCKAIYNLVLSCLPSFILPPHLTPNMNWVASSAHTLSISLVMLSFPL